ncbi:MAG: MMPL family transporter, partial [Deltaproteobacteria bacterium]|nr:MMPL family transporter [Deltaproteobacteria bacterium]
MSKLRLLLASFYEQFILKRPAIAVICLLAVFSFLGYKAKDFKLEASAETLLLERDEDLRYSRIIKSRYGGYDYLLMTYSPQDDLFSDKTLNDLRRLRQELMQLQHVSSVVSILDAPLLESPPVPVKELASHIQTLESKTIDRKLARIEFQNSPLYRNLLVSPDLKTTALMINFRIDPIYQDLLARRGHFQEKQFDGSLQATEIAELKKVTEELQNYRGRLKKTRHQDIAKIRKIMDGHRQDAELFLGGVSMIADDLISFIKKDLKVFGIGVLFFLVVTLSIIFRNSRWVILPILCCAFSAICTMGILGTFGWPVTVVSSNFISLQLIITMAITIHLIVRYRELLLKNPETEQHILVFVTVRLMVTPC